MSRASFGLVAVLAMLGQIPVSAAAAGVTAIAAGRAHSCALTAAGGVKCWGYNYYGDLGDGTSGNNALTPVDVSGLGSGVTAITAGADHTCALIKTGRVKCWGYNYFGQVGDGSVTDRHAPVFVTALKGVVAIAAGTYHTCALTEAGGVKCWGWNDSGQLGDSTTSDRHTPGFVTSLKQNVAAIAAGGSHTCALTDAGAVKCWGDNGDGEVGDSTTTNRLAPVFVTALRSGVAAIAVGAYHTCAVTEAGAVRCWGDNSDGQVGDTTTINRLTPVFVSKLRRGVTAVTAGSYHTCALTEAGSVKCWGNNLRGELGDGTTTNRLVPTAVSGLASGVTAMAGGQDHTCALTDAGGVKCWGWNAFGQVGDGTDDNALTPVDVGGL